jgi:VacB/RNase II family 3'-5' exoribonuclease
VDLKDVAVRVMRENGFQPEFPPAVLNEIADIARHPPAADPAGGVKDLRDRLWSSVDNDDSRDLDQIEFAEALGDGRTKVMIAIADVDHLVRKGSAIDAYASSETTSVYTGVRTFPMLPPELSNAATSLNENGERAAMVTEFVVSPDGLVADGAVYPALVRNHARLTYNAVGAWLEGHGPAPDAIAGSPELAAQIHLQDGVAQALRRERYRHGALDIETIETHAVLAQDRVVDIDLQQKTRASELIEDFMIAANGVVARTLDKVSSIRRIVRTPKRWDRIVALAAEQGGQLPAVPDSKALNDFLAARRAADPVRFPDLSLAVIKLMGPGEYVIERPGDPEQGHFGLAVEDYTHSTAPNRRFADLVTQRVLKAFSVGAAPPYSDDELTAIAANCTKKADDARKVERAMLKRIAAVAMSPRVGEDFDAIVTGAGPKGTFVRVLNPHVEGMLVRGKEGLDVGDRVRVKLVKTDVNSGFIDFTKV